MKQSQLKKQAKHLLKHLPGKYQLFAIPIALHIILLFIQLHQNYLVEQGISISTFASIFPILLNIFPFICSLHYFEGYQTAKKTGDLFRW